MINVKKAVLACPQKIPSGELFFQFVEPQGTLVYVRQGVKERAFIRAFNVHNISGVKKTLPSVFGACQFHIQHSDRGKQLFNIITQSATVDRDFCLRVLIAGVDGYLHILYYSSSIAFTQVFLPVLPEFPPKLPFFAPELHWQTGRKHLL